MQWKKHVYRVGTHTGAWDDLPADAESADALMEEARKRIEPWLSAVFQAEHLNLLLGSGFTIAIGFLAGVRATGMGDVTFGTVYDEKINAHADAGARSMNRGRRNIEDQLRSALAVHDGLAVVAASLASRIKDSIDAQLSLFLTSILTTETGIREGRDIEARETANGALESFLLSFASRAASRERLHIFTTNYDRLIEHGCDLAGLRIIDRFVGALNPVFRASRVEVDLHQAPRFDRLVL
jgi:hypothetical protein